MTVFSGTIARLTEKGFGFIAREGTEKDIFFHSNELADVQFGQLREGDTVGFEIIASSKGPSAANVRRNVEPPEETADDEEVTDSGDADPDVVMRTAVQIFTSSMAKGIARDPEVLEKLEWRDLERLIAEVFAGLGFDVELTPGSKDGGKDVIVSFVAPKGERKSYFVEIKHWRSGKGVKGDSISRFIHVIARENKTGGIFLATHGFAKKTIQRITEIEILQNKVGLATSKKVVGLCRDYVKVSEGIWYPPKHLDEVIFEDTVLL